MPMKTVCARQLRPSKEASPGSFRGVATMPTTGRLLQSLGVARATTGLGFRV